MLGMGGTGGRGAGLPRQYEGAVVNSHEGLHTNNPWCGSWRVLPKAKGQRRPNHKGGTSSSNTKMYKEDEGDLNTEKATQDVEHRVGYVCKSKGG